MKEEDKDVTFYLSEKHVLFEFENYYVTSRLIDGEYFNYEGAIPKQHAIEVKAEVDPFIDSIERAALIISNDTTKSPLRLNIKENKVMLHCASQIGKVSDTIEVEASGEKLEFGFNYKYLLDAFRGCDCEKVQMEFNSALSPCVLKPIEGTKFLYRVLPVRLPA